MKLAFSNTGCPAWDLATMFARAREYGYDGIELAALPGRVQLPLVPEVAADPSAVAQQAAEAGVAIVCLATAAVSRRRTRARWRITRRSFAST